MNNIDFTPPKREPTFLEFNYYAARSLAAVPPEVSHRLYFLRPDYVRFLREYMENYDERTLLLLRMAYEVSKQNLRVKEKRQTRGRDFRREEKNLAESEGEIIWYMTAGVALDSEEKWRKLIHEGAKRETEFGKQRDEWLPGIKYAAVPTEQLMSLKERLNDFRENFQRAMHEMKWREGVVDLTYFSFLKSYYLTLVPRITVLDNRPIALRLPWFINEAFINFRKDYLNRQLETCKREDKEIVKTAFRRLQLLSETRMKEHDHLLNTMNTLDGIAQKAFSKEPRKELCKLLGVRGLWPEAPPQREISEASFQFLH
ncbi:MAG: hypothetical protein KDK65_04630, partial [Chlamydiia bacterium]|nr:hypothetical protein [Chlamydiia bacterium]